MILELPISNIIYYNIPCILWIHHFATLLPRHNIPKLHFSSLIFSCILIIKWFNYGSSQLLFAFEHLHEPLLVWYLKLLLILSISSQENWLIKRICHLACVIVCFIVDVDEIAKLWSCLRKSVKKLSIVLLWKADAEYACLYAHFSFDFTEELF